MMEIKNTNPKRQATEKVHLVYQSHPFSIYGDWVAFVFNELKRLSRFSLQADAFRGRSVSLLVASACGVSPGRAFPAGVAAFHYNHLLNLKITDF